jgi:hypothetical protein
MFSPSDITRAGRQQSTLQPASQPTTRPGPSTQPDTGATQRQDQLPKALQSRPPAQGSTRSRIPPRQQNLAGMGQSSLGRRQRSSDDILATGHAQADRLVRARQHSPEHGPEPEDVDMHSVHSDSESRASGTDHSDTEDERAYQQKLQKPGARKREAARNREVASLLTASGYVKKLDAMAQDSPGDDALRKTMFSKATRPTLPGKSTAPKPLYRKEAKFLHPSDKLNERTRLDPPTAEQQQDLDALNHLLANGHSLEQAVDQLPHGSRFAVAQYRGMWYAPSKFSAEQRQAHRELDERDRAIFSQSALEQGPLRTAGYYALYNDPARTQQLTAYQKSLATHGNEVRQALKALDSTPVTPQVRAAVSRAGGEWDPQTLQDVSVHFYSQDYAGFHQALEEALARRSAGAAPEPADALFEGLQNAANPKVSTGDVPIHASKYAFGQKPYAGHEQDVLEPGYDATGKPARPYSGKLYTSIHPITDYDATNGPTQLVPMQADKRINISPMIIGERETQFDGMMEPGRVKAQHKAKFPNFAKDYKDVNAPKYGMQKDVFDAFAGAFKKTKEGSDERVYVEALLTSYLSRYADIRAVEEAQDLAQKDGARLVYRTGPKEFAFEPPKLP